MEEEIRYISSSGFTIKYLTIICIHRLGDIVYVEAVGRGILVLNTMEAVVDLLNDKANIYSDRPNLVMVGDMMGLNNVRGKYRSIYRG